MKAEFSQDGLPFGEAKVTLSFKQGDPLFMPGDSISLGMVRGAEGLEFISSIGDAWVGNPQPLKFAEAPKFDGKVAEFILHPVYVELMDDGPYTVVLLDANKKEKGRTEGLEAYDISKALLPETQALIDYQELEKTKEAERKKSEAAEAARAEEARRQAAAAKAEEERRQAEAIAKAEAERKQAEEARKQAEADAAKAEEERKQAEAKAEAERKEAAAAAAKAEEERKQAEAAAKAEEERKQAEAAAKAEEERKQAEAAAAALETEALTDSIPVAPAKKSKTGLIIAVVGLIVALAAGLGGYYWFSQQKGQETAEVKKEEAPAPVAEAPKEDPADAKGRVAKFFAGQRDPVSAMKLADELDKNTDDQKDLVYKLYFYAARENNPEGALKKAECLDPSKPQWGSIVKNAAEAWQAYGKSPDGAKPREEMKAWVEKEAASGNAEAKNWLGQMK